MQPVSVTGIEITYTSGALQQDIDFRSCKTFISIDGVVRTIFKRDISSKTQVSWTIYIDLKRKGKNNVESIKIELFEMVASLSITGSWMSVDERDFI